MIFIDNKYSRWYFSITSSANARSTSPNTYTEKHHIIPESFFKNRKRKGPPGWIEGDPDAISNIVSLTPKEHFICHVLLTKFTTGSAKSKMIFALIGMKRSRKHQHRYLNARLYESAKIEFAKIASVINLGRKHSDETKAKVSKASASRTHSAETRAKMSAVATGKKKSSEQIEKMKQFRHSEESKKKMSISQKGKTATVKTRAKMSRASKGEPKSEETKLKMSAAAKGKPKGPMSDDQKLKRSLTQKGRLSHKKGKIAGPQHTPESKAKIAESNRHRVYSQETKDKIAVGVKAANERRKLQK